MENIYSHYTRAW